jgi:2-oxoglutarate dehydrogenase complex dehydrogenase (E1) component-like enzyme
MGAWRFVRELFLDAAVADPGRRGPRYVGRPPSASPAPGSYRAHLQEQEAILRQALKAGGALY